MHNHFQPMMQSPLQTFALYEKICSIPFEIFEKYQQKLKSNKNAKKNMLDAGWIS